MITKGDLQNRDGGPQVEGKRVDRLALLEERLTQARSLKPSGKDLHCEDCFQRGRDAVLRLLGGEG